MENMENMENMETLQQGEQDILKQLGIEVPNITGMEQANPVAPKPLGVDELGNTMIASAILGLEMTLSIFGYASEKGQAITKAIDVLLDVIGEDKYNELKAQMIGMMGGMGGMPQLPQLGGLPF